MSSTFPDARGRFGEFGGRFVPETVMGALDELSAAWQEAWSDPGFHAELDRPMGAASVREELEQHWQQAAAVRSPVVVAGGLDPDNIGRAVRAVRPWAVDTARGVESQPGIKDVALIERFIHNAKDAA